MPISITKGINFNSTGDSIIKDDTLTGINYDSPISFSKEVLFQNNANFSNLNIVDFLNLNKSTVSNSFIISSSGTVDADFNNVDISYLSLSSSGAVSIILSVPLLTGNKTRELKLFVKSNGNYSFQNSTMQGSIIYWKTTNNTIGTQPVWSAFNNIVDSHTFIFDGSKLYHIETYSYVVSIIAPSNLNYSTNTFDLLTYTNHTLTPTLIGTFPINFSDVTSNLISGATLNSSTGVISIYRTSGIQNYVTTTIRAENGSGFTERSINIRLSHHVSSMTRGSYSTTYYNSFFQQSFTNYYYGYSTFSHNGGSESPSLTPFGSLSTTTVIGTYTIRSIMWNYGTFFGPSAPTLYVYIQGNSSSALGSFNLIIGPYTFVCNLYEYISNDPYAPAFNNTTRYGPGTVGDFNNITETQFNQLNALSNPILTRFI